MSVRRTFLSAISWMAAIACLGGAGASCGEEPPADPLADILRPAVRPALDDVIHQVRTRQRYPEANFPLDAKRFADFREDLVSRYAAALGLKDWVVRAPVGKKSPLAGKFRDRLLKVIELHGVTMEVHLIEILATGDCVPAVLSLPAGEGHVPGVCAFSGHGPHGLNDMVVNLESYQRGIAARLAQAGFATMAVEKIDTGYFSRGFTSGVDENPIATARLAWGETTRAHQLVATLAASEILAAHPRVDEKRIGATGVSLGGWLSIETALLSDRIAAVADFSRKTIHVPAEGYDGITDLCHIVPGMLSVCDRNVLALAYAPRPLLAGHGRRDTGSHEQGPEHFQRLFQEQYRVLGEAGLYEYHIHDGGDSMPAEAVVDYFRKVFVQR